MSVNIYQNGNLVSISDPEGHDIMDENGTILPKRSKMQFINAEIEDDDEHGITKVSAINGGGGGETPIATYDTPGKVMPDGETLLIKNDGTLSVNEFTGTRAEVEEVLDNLEDGAIVYITDDESGGGQEVPIATDQSPGIVQPDGITVIIDENGIISSASETPIATTEIAGKVKPDGTSITINENDGTIRTPTATSSTLGIVRPDNSTITIDGNGNLSANPGSVSWNNVIGKPNLVKKISYTSNTYITGLTISSSNYSVEQRYTFDSSTMSDGRQLIGISAIMPSVTGSLWQWTDDLIVTITGLNPDSFTVKVFSIKNYLKNKLSLGSSSANDYNGSISVWTQCIWAYPVDS